MRQTTEKSHVDLPNNWHSTSIAVKITAVVVWGVMPIAFALTIPLLSAIEKEIGKDNLWTLEHIHILIDQQFSKNLDATGNDIRNELIKFKKNYPFDYLSLAFKNEKIIIGEELSGSIKYAHDYYYESTSNPFKFSLAVHFPPIERGIELERMKYGSLIVIFTIILGLYLVYVIRNTLHSPFQRVIDATQNIIYGHLDTRLDIKSDDEFGHLSRFFNHMIEQLDAQQKSLTLANKHLEKVVQNKEMALAESRSKSLFLANMSHEIRTPMTAILGYAESLYRLRIHDEKEQQEALEAIYRNGKHLIHIINDILDLSKIEADKLQVECIPFSPIKVLTEVEQLMIIQAKEKGVALEFSYQYPLPEIIQNDPTRFKQVLFNLISNALRFTEKGQVIVSIDCSLKLQRLHITVTDNGIGLTEEQINHLFQPYVQAERSTSRLFGGTGLGLMISKRLVNLMGGEINVRSIVGKGATFDFDITTGLLENVPSVSEENQHSTLSVDEFTDIPQLKGHVLLVEDIEDNQKLISLYLRQAGLSVDIAANGQVGLDKALDQKFDLILMDMQMPVMDGLTATSTLRNADYKGPIIALTANVLKNERDIYLNAGCNAILTKPIVIDEFYETLTNWIDKKEDPVTPSANKINETSKVNKAFKLLVIQFLQSLEKEIHEIDQTIFNQEWEKCKKLVHNIKGRGGSFGYPELTTLATELESFLLNQQYDEFKNKFIQFKDYCRKNLKND